MHATRGRTQRQHMRRVVELGKGPPEAYQGTNLALMPARREPKRAGRH